jgi:hypothetical protein
VPADPSWRLWRTRKSINGHVSSVRRYTKPAITRARERNFVDAFWKRVVLAYPDLLAILGGAGSAAWRRIRLRWALRYLAAGSLKEAGYYARGSQRSMKKDGTPKGSAIRQADYLLNMPRIQAALAEKFDEAGLSVGEVAAQITKIAKGEARFRYQMLDGDGAVRDLERDIAPGDRLRALDMWARLTIGYAPTKATNLNLGGKIETFDPEAFDKVPPIKTLEQT